MKDQWTGVLIGKMHNAGVTMEDLAHELGVRKSYISMILNCRRRPKGAKETLNGAFDKIVKERNGK